MSDVDQIRNSLFDKLLTVKNKKLLKALDEILSSAVEGKDEIVALTDEQHEMLKMSEKNIAEDKVISQENLNEKDLEWLKNSLDPYCSRTEKIYSRLLAQEKQISKIFHQAHQLNFGENRTHS